MINLVGQKFGRLTVKALSNNRSGKRKRLMWICDCDCGNTNIEVVGEHLKSGHTKSCGCYLNEIRPKTRYNLSGEFGIGYTSKGEEFWFDLEDYDKIKDISWYSDSNGYIAGIIKGEGKCILLHRLIMNANENEIVDHIEHNTYDNRKSKLRIGTQSLNMMNSSLRKDNTSGIKGISKYSSDDKFHAEITVNKHKITLGTFANINDAISVRKDAEKKYFGDWSYDNSISR